MDVIRQTELHRHLDGSLRLETVTDLARRVGIEVPEPLSFTPGMGLDAALARFAFTVSLLQVPAHLTRVAHEMCLDAENEGTTGLEIRFAPQLHSGMSIEAAVDGVLEGIDGRAGLILCGLYGENPSVFFHLVEVAKTRIGVVGIDLAGGPAPHHSFGLKDYAPAFTTARDIGLGRTVHAGEGRPAQEIRDAIEYLHAQRIGHGVSVLNDRGVTDLVLERGVTIEACPTSNVHTGVIQSIGEHPIRHWLNRGIKIAVCTDNTLLSAVDLPTELGRVRTAHHLTTENMHYLAQCAEAARFKRS